MSVKLYLAEVYGKGYYARSQPTYEWCFTRDMSKAATYRTMENAQARVASDRYGSGHGRQPWRVVTVDGNLNVLEAPEFQNYPRAAVSKTSERGETITLSTLKKGA